MTLPVTAPVAKLIVPPVKSLRSEPFGSLSCAPSGRVAIELATVTILSFGLDAVALSWAISASTLAFRSVSCWCLSATSVVTSALYSATMLSR